MVYRKKKNPFIGPALFLLWTAICVAGGLIPETAMYFIWHLINSNDELVRLVLVLAFWFGGAGLCFLFGVLAFMVWIAGVKAWDESAGRIW